MYKYLFLLLTVSYSLAQNTVRGVVKDKNTGEILPFVSVSVNDKEVTQTNIDGFFTVPNSTSVISLYLKGFKFVNYNFKDNGLQTILLEKDPNIKIDYQQLAKQKVHNAVVNLKQNNPQFALPNYAYKQYEKLIVSAPADSISSKIDTVFIKKRGNTVVKLDSTNYKFKRIVAKNHLYQTEKLSNKIHYPTETKEIVEAVQMGGFKKPVYEYLGLQLQTKEVYNKTLKILETNWTNPISKRGLRKYNYYLIQNDTIESRPVYKIYFSPKNKNQERLRGWFYLDQSTFAIVQMMYRIKGVLDITSTHQFSFLENKNIWFPQYSELIIKKGNNKQDIRFLGGIMKFNATDEQERQKNASDFAYLKLTTETIEKDSKPQENNKNLKGIKITIPETALVQKTDFWQRYQLAKNDPKHLKTYISLDSISQAENVENKIRIGKKVLKGYFPFGFFDFDIRQFIKYNNFEGLRLGVGGKTNNKWSKLYSLSGYVAYGLKDEALKYSANVSYKLGKKSASVVQFGYRDEIDELAKISFLTDQVNFKIYDPRPFNITTFYRQRGFSAQAISEIIPKAKLIYKLEQNRVDPLFNYEYYANGRWNTNFNTALATVGFQWKPFSDFMQTPENKIEVGKNFPVFSVQYTQSLAGLLGNTFDFSKLDIKIDYEIPYLSGQRTAFLAQAGYCFGELPLTHSYSVSPNSLNHNNVLRRITFAGKDSFETMYFNEFFSSQYFQFQARHTFNRILFAPKIKPVVSVSTRFVVGKLDQKNYHQGIDFKTLEKGYLESGIEFNKIFYGLGLSTFYRYGPNQLPNFTQNLAIKISFHLDLGI